MSIRRTNRDFAIRPELLGIAADEEPLVLGVLSLREALQVADAIDPVVIAPQAEPVQPLEERTHQSPLTR
jgi:translation initiation factor IF-3